MKGKEKEIEYNWPELPEGSFPHFIRKQPFSVTSVQQGIKHVDLLQWGNIGQLVPLTKTEISTTSIVRSIAEVNTLQEIKAKIFRIENVLQSIEDRPLVYTATINDIGDDRVCLVSTINIVIEQYKDEFIARYPDLALYGEGDIEQEAILNLKKEIVSLFFDLRSIKKDELGPMPYVWQKILKRILKAIK